MCVWKKEREFVRVCVCVCVCVCMRAQVCECIHTHTNKHIATNTADVVLCTSHCVHTSHSARCVTHFPFRTPPQQQTPSFSAILSCFSSWWGRHLVSSVLFWARGLRWRDKHSNTAEYRRVFFLCRIWFICAWFVVYVRVFGLLLGERRCVRDGEIESVRERMKAAFFQSTTRLEKYWNLEQQK